MVRFISNVIKRSGCLWSLKVLSQKHIFLDILLNAKKMGFFFGHKSVCLRKIAMDEGEVYIARGP